MRHTISPAGKNRRTLIALAAVAIFVALAVATSERGSGLFVPATVILHSKS